MSGSDINVEEATGIRVSQEPCPDISVVVPTFNRRQAVCALLESLSRQTLPNDQFEVIIVSDGSTDGTADAAGAFAPRFSKLQVLDLPNRGPAAARNAGARVATGEYLAFTDDDCIPASNWLQQILLAFERTEAVGIHGRTTTDHRDRTPLTHQIEILQAWTSSMSTCNAAYRKSAFELVGSFCEQFKFAHNEDRDLAWRIEEVGRLVFEPDIHVFHPPRSTGFLSSARRVRNFESDFLLYRRNPDKYRLYVASSPWRTIYFHVALVQQLKELRSNFRYLVKTFQPMNFVTGIGIVCLRWFYLLCFLPSYLAASRRYGSTWSPAAPAMDPSCCDH